MPQDIKIWSVVDGSDLVEIKPGSLALEARLEEWLEKDISIISDDLLVIGRQVTAGFGGVIDLLCLNFKGDVVILELKRDKTPRDVVAQTLDYATWVKGLSYERITELANSYLDDKGPLDKAFGARFKADLPEALNEHHEMLVVASEIDSSTERIIKYLSDYGSISINAATFRFFRDGEGRELLARVFLIEPSDVGGGGKGSKRRPPPLSLEELSKEAFAQGVGELYQRMVERLREQFDRVGTTLRSIAFIGRMEGSFNTILSLIPGESNASNGLRFQVYIVRLAKYLGVDEADATSLLPPKREKWNPLSASPEEYRGYTGFFKDREEVKQFLEELAEIKQRPREVSGNANTGE